MDTILLNRARFIQVKALEAGIPLRLIGGVGVFEKCVSQRAFLKAKRSSLRGHNADEEDIDFVSLLLYKNKLEKFFRSYNFKIEKDTATIPYSRREIFILKGKERIECDVNYDVLRYNTTIDFRKRFFVDSITLPTAELLLSKLQPTDFKAKHLIDVIALLNEFDLTKNDLEGINIDIVADLCSSNWCLENNVRKNLRCLMNGLNCGIIEGMLKEKTSKKIDEIYEVLNTHPKSILWQIQSNRFGRLLFNCYQDTEDIEYEYT